VPRSEPQTATSGSDPPLDSLGGVVAEADPAVVKERREDGPALQHVVYGLVEVMGPGGIEPLLLEIGVECAPRRSACSAPGVLRGAFWGAAR
jgi:hypothetical protein